MVAPLVTVAIPLWRNKRLNDASSTKWNKCTPDFVFGASLDLNEAMNLAGLGGDVSSVPARLRANSFDSRDNCGSFNAMKHISQEHQQLIRIGLVETSVKG